MVSNWVSTTEPFSTKWQSKATEKRENQTKLPFISPYKPRILFVGRRQIMQTQTRRRRTRRLIRVSTVFLQNVLLKFE